jgi:pimeloyl-ACP methyl ester carboxylesterase
MASSSWWMLASAALTASACAEELPQHLRSFPETDYTAPTQWAPCAFDVNEPSDRRAECGFVNLPLDYERPDAGRFRVLVKRVEASDEPTAQVWMLHGGPGASATADLHRLSFGIPEERPDIAYYAVDHRGMGGSESIGCQEPGRQPDDPRDTWAACMESLESSVGAERLSRITTSNAARDLGTLIEKYRAPGVTVIVNGNSYGTTLAHRYMQMYPEQPDGVVLIGIELGSAVFHRDGKAYGYGVDWDRRNDDAVSKIFERCALADACVRHFDEHPWETAKKTMASLYDGHCAELGIEPDHVKETLGALSYAAPLHALPALITRLRRCNEDDRRLLRNVVQEWHPEIMELDPPLSPASYVAGNIISASEAFANQADDAATLQRAFSQELTVAYGVEKFYAQMRDVWFTYPTDEYYGHWASYRRPLLMLQGALDTATPLTQALIVRARFAGPLQTWVLFPDGNHSLVNRTPTVDGVDCARSLFLQFIDEPRRQIDPSCVARTVPIDWNDSATSRKVLGIDDLWGGSR